MGSSKKHKKHKDRKHSSSNLCDESNHSFNSISNNSVISGEQGTLKLVLRVPGASNSPHMSPSIIQNQEYNQGEMMQLGGTEGNVHSDGRPYSSSSKKMKKKKSKKKHKKHSHHHSHHHHSHHHRHKSSCSHHSSKSSSSTTNLINVLPPIPTSLVQTATSTNQLQQPPYLMNSSSSNLDFSQDIQQQNVNLIDPQILPNLTSIPQQSNNQQFSNLSNQSQSIMIDQTTSLQNTNLTSPPPQITSPNNCSFNSNNSNELMNNNLYNPNVNYNMNNYGNNMMNLNEPSNNLQNTIGNLNTNINNNNMISHHLNVSPIVSPPPISTNNFITQNQTPQFASTSETSPISANQLITVNNLNNQQTSIQQSPIQQQQIQAQIQTQIQPQIQPQIQTQIQQQPAQNQQQPCIQKSSNLNQQQQLARTPIGVKPIAKTQFQSLLGYLLKQLEKRDSQEFFFYPVTDLIAPGYSSIITKPMDFSKIRHKINLNSYENLIQFRSDVKLMCDNAMTYNRQDTIYFKAAKKLWHYARDKIFNRDSVLELVKLYQGVTNYELGLTCADYSDSEQLNVPAYDDFSHINEQMVNAQLEFMQQSKDDEPELTADQILEEVKKSAQVAADRLSLMKPKGSKYTLLRQLDDGTTSLAIVGSSINGYQEEKYVNLESLVGKLKDGSPHLPAYKESELNLAKPIEILESSPFSSYLPSSDSTKSNLTDKESALLLSTYGDDIGLSYSQSLLKFASDSDYVLTMVDSLLDALTNGQHTKVMNDLKENKESEDKMETNLTTNEDVEMQDTNLKSDLDKKLNETTKLVTNLETIQHQRLSSSTQPIKPNKEEMKVAHLLTNKLTELIGNYTVPADITDIKSLRKCLGVKENFFN